ncbi:hypothetical protein BDY21DRAFT_49464 [Lineolata rhizophorae]|uniref:Uncharacterized protein n=1 Tax=Lineolata rhizophorae TaxID=578093 RepID=A0A6A6NYP8_9PEZI|nr:hypothetical protein BDY21DRAFT_49464 [Lineolata rhizophorae]
MPPLPPPLIHPIITQSLKPKNGKKNREAAVQRKTKTIKPGKKELQKKEKEEEGEEEEEEEITRYAMYTEPAPHEPPPDIHPTALLSPPVTTPHSVSTSLAHHHSAPFPFPFTPSSKPSSPAARPRRPRRPRSTGTAPHRKSTRRRRPGRRP